MKKHAYIAVIILSLLCSCTAKKVAQQSIFEQKEIRQNSIIDTKTDQTKTLKSVAGQLSDSIQKVTKTTRYDTSKPVQSVTGRPPVSEETTTVEVKIGNRIMSVTTETANNVNSELTYKSKIQAYVQAENKIIETPKPPAVKYYLYILITLVVVAIGLFVYMKFKKKSLITKS